jgi:hypothetical protein
MLICFHLRLDLFRVSVQCLSWFQHSPEATKWLQIANRTRKKFLANAKDELIRSFNVTEKKQS